MIIEFKSQINQNGKSNFIEFKSPVKIYKRNDFNVYEFEDPKSKMMNMIEISQTHVNIFVGTMTINLELNKNIKIDYLTANGNVSFISFLKKLNCENNKINFTYSLSNQTQTVLGEYNISLQIFNELN